MRRAVPLLVPSLILLSAPALAGRPAEVAPGQVYAGGQRVGFSSLGVSFVIPKGMQGRLNDDGSAFVMVSQQPKGLLVGVADKGTTLEEVQALLSSPIPLDPMTVLQPAGPAKRRGGEVVNAYSVESGGRTWRGAARAKVLDNGTAVAFLSVAPKEKRARRRLQAAFRSLRVMKTPKAPKSAGPWAARLRGKRLTYMKTANGLSTEKHVDLCANGRFYYRGEESYLSGGFTAAGAGRNEGTWAARGSVLVLTWADGSVDRRTLSRQGGKTFVDGTRWFLVDAEGCP